MGQQAWLRALEGIALLERNSGQIIPVLLDELSGRFGNSLALLSDREIFTFQELAQRSNQYARWVLEQELAPGTVVGLIMHNRPEYLAIWLGITRMGCVVALLNTNLKGEVPLLSWTPKHLCFRSPQCRRNAPHTRLSSGGR